MPFEARRYAPIERGAPLLVPYGEISPVELGFGQAMHARGTPRLAVGDEAAAMLRDFARLSQPFGTHIKLDGERAMVSR